MLRSFPESFDLQWEDKQRDDLFPPGCAHVSGIVFSSTFWEMRCYHFLWEQQVPSIQKHHACTLVKKGQLVHKDWEGFCELLEFSFFVVYLFVGNGKSNELSKRWMLDLVARFWICNCPKFSHKTRAFCWGMALGFPTKASFWSGARLRDITCAMGVAPTASRFLPLCSRRFWGRVGWFCISILAGFIQ